MKTASFEPFFPVSLSARRVLFDSALDARGRSWTRWPWRVPSSSGRSAVLCQGFSRGSCRTPGAQPARVRGKLLRPDLAKSLGHISCTDPQRVTRSLPAPCSTHRAGESPVFCRKLKTGLKSPGGVSVEGPAALVLAAAHGLCCTQVPSSCFTETNRLGRYHKNG